MGTSLAEDVTCSRLSSEPGDCPPVCVLEEVGSGQLCQCLRPSADFTGEKTNPVSHQRDLRSPISFVSNQGDLLSSSLVATNSLTLQRQQLSWSPNAVHQVVLLLFYFTGIETAQEDGMPVFRPLHPHPSVCTSMSTEDSMGTGSGGRREVTKGKDRAPSPSSSCFPTACSRSQGRVPPSGRFGPSSPSLFNG